MYDLEKPFHRLIHHFITRLFHGAGEGDELQFSIPVLLGLLSTPAAFGSIVLLNKYSTLALFLRRRPYFDVYRASIPDEYFFIVYSMVITGAVVILKWDRLFPDRQDYDNLAVLPISGRQMFQANLIAILFLAVLFAVDINWAACIIFPFAVTSRYDTFAAYSEFFIAHGTAMVLSSIFACFGLLSILGLTMLVTPRRFLQKASLLVRITCALGLVAILGSAFTIPLTLLSPEPPNWLSYLPPVWFLELNQALLNQGRALTGTAIWSVEAVVGVFILAIGIYAATYRRQFMRIPEQTGLAPVGGRDEPTLTRRLIEWAVVRSPFQRATYYFAFRTLFRSERHSLLLGTSVGAGFFVAAQAFSEALAAPVRSGVLDQRLLSIPLILTYVMVVSLRALFDLPTDRRANWVFRAIVDKRRHEARPLAAKILLTMIVPWLVLVATPLHIHKWGWRIGLLHTGWVLLCTVLLVELLLIGFRKIPFTCTQTASKDRILVMLILFLVGLSVFSSTNTWWEVALLRAPLRFLFVVPWFLAVFLILRSRERDLIDSDRVLVFEDRPAAVLQPIDLSH